MAKFEEDFAGTIRREDYDSYKEYRKAKKRESYRRNKHKHLPKINESSKQINQKRREASATRARSPVCEVCGEQNSRSGNPSATCWDHNHATGEFRGWLCARCNMVLGRVGDSSELLKSLADYVASNGKSVLPTPPSPTAAP
ncbi:endonuclease domain-containing protein [Sinorhizobium meliloti]|uniref:endonuclease domain-containing protein n=1 Tax=Rhizobium meliloti TaxID=382 RepID=UPI000FDC781B|nr:endonuclease domain-containing protein [Sinorhizobium meliloti]RVN04091.1 hypothetical protein CN112_26170 [Sinorhizobium meliloti]